MPYVSVNEIELYYEDTGPPPDGDDGGPVVVFLHGAGGNHISWWQQIPFFRGRYRCIAIDHRGFANSVDTTGESNERFVEDLEGLLEQLGIERVALVAQSMGGRTALGFAVRHHRRVAALVMADTWGFFDWPELRDRAAKLREELGSEEAPLAQRALSETFREQQPARAFLYEQIGGLNPPRNLRSLTSGEGAPSRDDVADLAVPTLFIVGSEDPLTPPPILQEVHTLVHGSEYREFAGCGHSVYFEDPEGFNELVGDFLGRHV